jgi:hypothetical protein
MPDKIQTSEHHPADNRPLSVSDKLAMLKAGREKSKARLMEIALAILHESGVASWAFHKKGLCGRAYLKRKHVEAPIPTTRRRLYILAHECGHIACGHTGSKPSHRKEYEAEIYAHEALRRHQIAVPKKETHHAKQYVARRIDQAIRIGKAKRLDREAVNWCKNEHRPATRKALAKERIRLVDLSGR